MSSESNLVCTRLVHLDMGQVRDAELNCGTVLGVAGLHRSLPAEVLFVASYRSIREIAGNEAPGAAIIAVHAPTGRLAGRVWIAGTKKRPNVAIIGRHSVCDLVLDAPSVSLRHVALIVPPRDGAPQSFTVHDLRTPEGLKDADGHPMGGALVEGAGIFRVGPYALFAFATGWPGRWPELATEAWQQLAGRTSAVSVVRPLPRAATPLSPSVTAIRGPIQTDEVLLEPGSKPACVLHVSSDGRRVRLALGEDALRRGVLLGRYARCDTNDLLVGNQISRVHALVLGVGGDVFAFDTASTNGLYTDPRASRPARVVALSGGEMAVLGSGDAMVEIRS